MVFLNFLKEKFNLKKKSADDKKHVKQHIMQIVKGQTVPLSQCTSDIDNSVVKRSDTGKTVVYWRVSRFCILFIEYAYLESECQLLTASYTLIVAFQLPTYQQFFALYLSFYLVAWWHVAYGRFQSVYFSLIWATSDSRYGEISRFGKL